MRALITGVLLLVSLSFAQDPELVNKAEQGDAEAQYNLGVIYALGNKDIRKDDAEALKWLKSAADQGYAEAQYRLGVMYVTGIGVNLDRSQALDWFRKACDSGDNDGCETYAEMKKGEL